MLEDISETRQQVDNLTTAFSEMATNDDEELLSELEQMTLQEKDANHAESSQQKKDAEQLDKRLADFEKQMLQELDELSNYEEAKVEKKRQLI